MKQRGLLPGRDDNDNDEWVGVSSATFHSALPCLTEPFGCCGGSARKRNDRHWSSGSERATLIWNLNHKSSKLLERRRTNTITIRKAPRWYGFVRLWVCTLAVALSLSCRGGGVVDAADAAAAAGVLQHRRATHPGSTPWRRMGTPQQQQRRWQQQQISSSSNSSSSSNPSAQPTTTPLPVATPPAAAAPRSIPSTLPTAVPFRDPTTPVPSARPSRRASMAPTTPPSGSPSDALIRFRSSSPSDAPSMLPSAENTITTNATIVVQGRLLKMARTETGALPKCNYSPADGGAMEETESETATLEPVLLVSSSHLERIRRTQEEPPSTADDDDDGGGDDNDDGGSQQTASPTEEPQGDTSEPTTPPMSELDPTEAPIPVDNQGTMSPTNAPILPKATNAPMGMPVLNTLLPTLAPVKQEDLEGDAACSAYPACASLGLIDDCCPGPDGKLLDCCQDTSNPTSTSTLIKEVGARLSRKFPFFDVVTCFV